MTVEISREDLIWLSVACIAYASMVKKHAEECSGEQHDNMQIRAQRWARASRRIKDVANSHPLYERKEVLELGIGE